MAYPGTVWWGLSSGGMAHLAPLKFSPSVSTDEPDDYSLLHQTQAAHKYSEHEQLKYKTSIPRPI